MYDILPWLVFVTISVLCEVRAEAEEAVLDLNITTEQICFKSPRLWFVEDYEIQTVTNLLRFGEILQCLLCQTLKGRFS